MAQKISITNRPLSDMESDGVYFPNPVAEAEPVEEALEPEICHYSGLPSVLAYAQIQEADDEA